VIDRAAIAREAMRSALQVRRNLAISREQPVNPFETAEALGIDVWFTDTPSLEGMYARTDDARIFVPSLNHRPFGRVSFSCAHELGHAQLGHGDHVDQYLESGVADSDPKELGANVFASSLLLPRPAVCEAFRVRGVDPATAPDLTMLSVAFEMNVGLDTLIKHLRWGLDLIDGTAFVRLKKLSPKGIRAKHFGAHRSLSTVVPLDEAWRSSAIDIEVGHAIAIPKGLVAKDGLQPHLTPLGSTPSHQLWQASRPGVAFLEWPDRRTHIRVARAGFQGQWRFRYLEDSEPE